MLGRSSHQALLGSYTFGNLLANKVMPPGGVILYADGRLDDARIQVSDQQLPAAVQGVPAWVQSALDTELARNPACAGTSSAIRCGLGLSKIMLAGGVRVRAWGRKRLELAE